jgi:hypothetical protein
VVDSVSSGNCVAAMVFVADGLEIMWFNCFSYSAFYYN